MSSSEKPSGARSPVPNVPVSEDGRESVAESGRATAEQATLTNTSAPVGQLDGLDVYGTRRRVRIRALAVLAAVVIAAAIVIATNLLGGSGKSNGGVSDNGAPTSLATVERGSLSQQTEVSATLGYAGSSNVLVPSGNAPTAVSQARQTMASAEGTLANAKSSLASDASTLETLQSSIAATKAKAAVDCAGDDAVASAASSKGSESAGSEGSGSSGSGSSGSGSSGSGSSGSGSSGSGSSGSTPCESDEQALASDEQSLPQDSVKVESDRTSLASAQSSLASDRSAYAESRSTATSYAEGAAYTALPSVGQIIHRGQGIFSIAGQPTVLLYGGTPATRAFIPGMSPGKDVAELDANLEALGYGHGLSGDAFTSATSAAIRAFQSAHGMSATGELLLGSVVFWHGPLRVTSVTPSVGSTVSPGPALAVSGTGRQVTIKLEASQQSSVKVGDHVTITLPDNETTPGVVSSVGTVATSSSSQSGEEGTPTVEVTARPTNPAATGHLDKAPVQVSITTAHVENVLSVPVSALLALAGGGYAVEVVAANGVHHLEAVTTGLFDDAAGRVQVSGAELAVSQRVVVPTS
jgi:peptidoglycan hydrolase-like protein with peptidoglycan-binding domain